jgi:hypothetical protein
LLVLQKGLLKFGDTETITVSAQKIWNQLPRS